MFTTCPICQGAGIPTGLMVFRVAICPKCLGLKIINEFTGLPPGMDDLGELVEREDMDGILERR